MKELVAGLAWLLVLAWIGAAVLSALMGFLIQASLFLAVLIGGLALIKMSSRTPPRE